MSHPKYFLKDGTQVQSVTTIIGNNLGWGKAALVAWSNKIGREGLSQKDFMEKAGRIGTISHDLIEANIKGIESVATGTPEEMEKAQQAFENFLHWKESVRFEPIRTEISMVSEEYRYGGTCDCVALIQGEPCLFDWKSSNSVHVEYLVQLAGYAHLLRENEICDPQGFYLLRIEKDGGAWSYHFWKDLSAPWEVFKRLVEINEYAKSIKV